MKAESKEVGKFDQITDKFAFYGTLRPGGRNYGLVDVPGTEVVAKTVAVPGFKMYGTRFNFPYVRFTGNDDDTIIVDLMKVPAERNAWSVHWMELGAGYHVREITVDGETYWIYAYDDKTHKELSARAGGSTEIPDGNWFTYLGETEAARKSVWDRHFAAIKRPGE